MSFTIQPITDPEIWNQFVNAQQPDTFLQSWAWGEFNDRMKKPGEEIIRLGCYIDNVGQPTLIAVALWIKTVAKRGTYWFCPHGPIVQSTMLSPTTSQPNTVSPSESIQAVLQDVIQRAKADGSDFVRCAPLLDDTESNQAIFTNAGWRPSPIHSHPELAWIVDITPSEDDIMSGMEKRHRYSIRKAMKDGVTVRTSTDEKDIDMFNTLYQETVDRQGFTPFSREYLHAEFATFHAYDMTKIFVAEYQGDPIAAAIMIFTPASGFYHQGASSRKYAKIPATQLIQWAAIQEAKRRGCQRYNFWGIADTANRNHPWYGLSLFKKGFGGYAQPYVHSQDYVLTPKYWLNFTIETIRRKRRGY